MSEILSETSVRNGLNGSQNSLQAMENQKMHSLTRSEKFALYHKTLELRRLGWGSKRISGELRMSKTTVRSWIKHGRKPYIIEPNRIARAKELYNTNVPLKKISQETGISAEYIFNFITKDRCKKGSFTCGCGRVFTTKRALNIHRAYKLGACKLSATIIEEYQLGKTAREISKQYGLGECSVFNLLRAKGVTRGKRDAIKLAWRRGKFKHFLAPKIRPNLNPTPNLAYILGTLVGDGWVSKTTGNYDIGLRAKDIEFCQRFKEALTSIELNPWISSKPEKDGRWSVRARSKSFYEWFKNLSEQDIRNIVQTSPECEREFVCAFYDSEGSLFPRSRSQWRVTIGCADRWIIEFFKELILRNGIAFSSTHQYSKNRRKTIHQTQLDRLDQIKMFLEWIQTSIPRKSISRFLA